MISEKDKALISILGESLKRDPVWKSEWDFLSESEMCEFGLMNNLNALLYRVLEKKPDESSTMQAKKQAQNSVMHFYRLAQVTAYAVKVLNEAQIDCVVLKGVSLAKYYYEPEVRTFLDIDILVRDKGEQAVDALKTAGFTLEIFETSKHHIPLKYENVLLELHTGITSDFDNDNANKQVRCLAEKLKIHNEYHIGSDYPMMSDGQTLCVVIVHMLQHFLSKGLGIKLLCDWVAILRNGVDEVARREYLDFVKKMRIKGFSDMITQICVNHLKLEAESIQWLEVETRDGEEEFLNELLSSGNFGNVEGRMVTARKPTLGGLFFEFHHQMKVNHPKASKCFLLWPVLWVVTFICFVGNNKKLKRGSTKKILATARKRGEMAQLVALWRE